MSIEIKLFEPTSAQLKIGRGEASGKGGKWRVFELDSDAEFMAHYVGAIHSVRSQEDWAALPEFGLQVIAGSWGGVCKGADEYRMGGVSKYGLYLGDDEYNEIERVARAN